MPNKTCAHGKTAPAAIMDALPDCAVCAYDDGFKRGIALKELATHEETKDLLNLLREHFPGYEVTESNGRMHFKCEAEKFKADYSLRVLLEMYREGEIETMFLAPAFLPE